MGNIEKVEEQIQQQQQNIDFDTREFTIEYIVDKYEKGVDDDTNEIYVPDYQREFVWDEIRQSKLIESIILGLPIPLIFLAENSSNDNRLEIVDGSQRIRTLSAFLKDDLQLKGLEKLDKLNGYKFSQMSNPRQRKFKNTPLRMIVLTDKATDEVRNEIFERINRGSDLLQAMEKRKGIYKGVFSNFIYEICAKNKLFNKLTRIDNRQGKRQEKEELILRFFALKDNYNKFPKNTGVAKFLDEYLDEKNKELKSFEKDKIEDYLSKSKILYEYYKEFELMLDTVYKYFKYGFSRNHTPQVSRVYFEAISVGVYLALKENPNLKATKEDVQKWLNSNEFKSVISGKYHTHTPQRIKERIEFVKNKLLSK
ncbi:DUF262 domain-containing protein [Capnocytophaga stomatis]|uniref:DUF262 domain-containing protein n=1 Tax=Capnocytophaga stomatis TaxID=1848904 RepID=A0ABW8QAW5_9FLAO|nr:DUF262 domain-containing protein [Capnocytophaga stomatis]GIJ93589.1 hypothetical protein CAPN002_08070 [Capnocytophaga stomatis]